MNHTYLRQEALDRFSRSRRRAEVGRWWRRLRRQPHTLLPLGPIQRRLHHLSPLPAGIFSVPVAQIVGSAQRAHEYDRQFRPLNDGLRDRWVKVNVLHQTAGWEPVELVQVGNLYFVVDGHHRISVARNSGVSQVEAAVTRYPLPLHFDPADSLPTVLARLETFQRAGCGLPATGYTSGVPSVTCNL